MFFGTSQSKPQKTPVIIFDIGGTSVGAALVLLASGEKPYIIHTVREWLRPMEEVSLPRLTGLLEAAIDSVSADLLSLGAKRLAAAGQGNRLPRTVDCFVTAPWYVPHMGSVHIGSGKPFTVTQRILESATTGEKKSIEKKLGITSAKEGREFAVIEQHILSLAINGYATEAPYGRSARDIDFLLYTALADQKPLNCFNERIGRTFHVDTLGTRSFLLAFFSAIRDSNEADEDYLLLDVSGEVTEVSVVRSGTLTSSVSYPLGRNFLIRTLSAECAISPEEALSLFAIRSSQQGNSTLAARFCSAVDRVEGKWMRQFEQSLAHVAHESFLPHSVFLVADKKIAPWISAAVQNEALYQYTLTAKPFVTNLADEKVFDAHVAFAPGVSKDAFLMIDALFLNKIRS
ncbi:MAG: hypothetical protein HYT29_01590 [Parcubacteria group bacterium]|nr:hypothetical protein [Parcubacteria group bacterium]